MNRAIRCSLLVVLATLFVPPARSEEPRTKSNLPSESSDIQDPLLRVLVTKGVLSAEEARTVATAAPAEQRDQLTALLHKKGVLSDAEFAALQAPAPAPVLLASASPTSLPVLEATARRTPPPAPVAAPPAAPPAAPSVVSAVAPLRVLPVDIPKREGIIPDIKLGSTNARVKPYGMVKSSVIYDSSSPGGNDMPLPGFLGDTGPDASPEFHIKARFFRVGTNFEWLDPSPKWVVTGRFEADFEGNFSRANNRNISTIRSSMFSIRLAWGRVDRLVTDKTSVFWLFGQDWSPFGSSTIPNLIETTGLGLGFGTLYERVPQFRMGVTHKFAGSRNFSITPEIAASLAGFGNDPANIADQLAYGERQGADSARPDVQGRVVLQFQLDKAPAVPPAQIIGSFIQGRRQATVLASSIPAQFKSAFPFGSHVSSGRYGYSAEIQLPTRAFTLLGKYYSGEDLRWYFVGQLFSNFNDTAGLTSTVTVPSIDGSSNVVFGLRNGVPAVAPQRAVRTQGGFVNVGLPISRWFGANASGRNAGWTGNLIYTYDYAYARDVRRFAGGRSKGGIYCANLNYKLNSIVTFSFEQSSYWTRTANSTADSVGGLSLFRGIPSRYWHDNRSELATIFAF